MAATTASKPSARSESSRRPRPRLSGSHAKVPADPELSPLGGERGRGDQVRLDLGERPLLKVGERAVDQLADDEAEHRVAEELQPLVVRRGGLPPLVGVGLVRERPRQELAIAELVPQDLLEVGQRFHDRVAHPIFLFSGAGGRSRTGTGLFSPRDFKSRASTNFATPARGPMIPQVPKAQRKPRLGSTPALLLRTRGNGLGCHFSHHSRSRFLHRKRDCARRCLAVDRASRPIDCDSHIIDRGVEIGVRHVGVFMPRETLSRRRGGFGLEPESPRSS